MSGLAIINTDTGEKIDERNLDPSKRYRITERSKKQDEYNATHIMKFNSNAAYGKIYVDMSEHIEEELTQAEWMFFTRLMKYICYDDCTLRPHGDRRFTAFSSMQEIATALNKTYSTVYRLMNALIAKELIIVLYTGDGENKTVGYACNPYVFFRGKDIDKTVFNIFNKTRWARFNEEVAEEEMTIVKIQ